MWRGIVNENLVGNRMYNRACDICHQSPIRGRKFLCFRFESGIRLTCQSCFAQLPPDEHQNYFFLVIPSAAARSRQGATVNQETRAMMKDADKSLCENSVIFWLRHKPFYMVRKMYASWKGNYAYHNDSRCSGCGTGLIYGWIFHCLQCNSVSLCQHCCLDGQQLREHIQGHGMLAIHPLQMKHIIREDLKLLSYGGIFLCRLVILFALLGKLSAILWPSIQRAVCNK